MAFARGIIGLLFAILLAVFAVANRQPVDVAWSPVHPAATLPLYVVALGLLAIGFIAGGFLAWFSTLPLRWERGRQSKQIKNLEKELGAAQQTGESVVQDLTMLPAGGDRKTT